MNAYGAFLEAKAHHGSDDGFEPSWIPEFLFDFQRALVEWACHKGRAAIFADCGLGKTPMELVWAENVTRRTNRPVLIVTPLAVSAQTIDEGRKFGLEPRRSIDGTAYPGLTVTNYERLHHFNPDDFAGVVCNESSILKSFDGPRRNLITEFLRRVEFRLLETATAAPNDYIELGTSSEALGWMGYIDMLSRFFKSTRGTTATNRSFGVAAEWRLKGHAERDYWRWVCSWARAIRRPSDLGFDDARFVLPALEERQHVVAATTHAPGMLPLDLPAVGLHEQREEQRRTLGDRCARVAALVNGTGRPFVSWCHLNDEGDLLAKLIPDARQVSGADSIEEKEDALGSFARGETRGLVIKPKIGAWGLNWQHCAHMTFFPSHSFEQYYQAVRRCWRFGQTRPVVVDVVTTDGGASVLRNLHRKAAQADAMFSRLVAQMNDALAISTAQQFLNEVTPPAWL